MGERKNNRVNKNITVSHMSINIIYIEIFNLYDISYLIIYELAVLHCIKITIKVRCIKINVEREIFQSPLGYCSKNATFLHTHTHNYTDRTASGLMDVLDKSFYICRQVGK